MKKTSQKLQLQRQTLRVLVNKDLEQVAGGQPGGGRRPCTNNESGCSNNMTDNCGG